MVGTYTLDNAVIIEIYRGRPWTFSWVMPEFSHLTLQTIVTERQNIYIDHKPEGHTDGSIVSRLFGFRKRDAEGAPDASYVIFGLDTDKMREFYHTMIEGKVSHSIFNKGYFKSACSANSASICLSVLLMGGLLDDAQPTAVRSDASSTSKELAKSCYEAAKLLSSLLKLVKAIKVLCDLFKPNNTAAVAVEAVAAVDDANDWISNLHVQFDGISQKLNAGADMLQAVSEVCPQFGILTNQFNEFYRSLLYVTPEYVESLVKAKCLIQNQEILERIVQIDEPARAQQQDCAVALGLPTELAAVASETTATLINIAAVIRHTTFAPPAAFLAQYPSLLLSQQREICSFTRDFQ